MAQEQILYLYDDLFLEHKTGNHPETFHRLNWINTAINSSSIKDKVKRISPTPASREDILRIHTEEYICHLEEAIEQKNMFLDADTIISEKSLDAAYLAAGAGIVAANEIVNGKIKTAFCAVRPPGHHAETDRAMGFCLFNNVAITARYLQEVLGMKKIVIVDWDVHHGNGTEKSFYHDDTVFYISLHQYPHYPGTGARKDVGIKNGEGYNLNIPMEAGSGDEEYLKAFSDEVIPNIEKFAPDFILISAGFDAHQKDMLASMRLTSETYGTFTEMIESASSSAQGRIISFLEGGYEPIGLSEGVLYHLKAL